RAHFDRHCAPAFHGTTRRQDHRYAQVGVARDGNSPRTAGAARHLLQTLSTPVQGPRTRSCTVRDGRCRRLVLLSSHHFLNLTVYTCVLRSSFPTPRREDAGLYAKCMPRFSAAVPHAGDDSLRCCSFSGKDFRNSCKTEVPESKSRD